jgi:glycosyltransferase involved in cell wall biosynthesis
MKTDRHVVMFAAADWAAPNWTNSQHTAVHLAARGYRVLFVETVGLRKPGLNAPDARRILRRLRTGLSPIRPVQEGIWLLSPLTIPWAHRARTVAAFNQRMLRHRIGRWVPRGGEQPLVWTYHPYMLHAAGALEAAGLVYHCVDDVAAMPGIDGRAYAAAEKALLAHATHVFASSRLLYDRCRAFAPERTHYSPNVADLDHFAPARREGPIPPDLAAIPRPRLGYVGALSDFKLDLELIEEAARRRDDWHWVLIGEERAGQRSAVLARLGARGNVHLLGWRPYAALPDYLRGIDVALLPQRINDYTRAMFPMKLFEYLAAGRPVVATPLPSLNDLRGLFRPAESAGELVEAVAAALAAPAEGVPDADDPVLRTHTWGSRVDVMLALVERGRSSSSVSELPA